MRLVDTHTHLLADVFRDDLDAVLRRARDAGIVRIIVVSETLEEAVQCLALCARHPMLLPAVGLFPTHLDPGEAREVAALAREHRHQVVAIGEVGLDYWVVKEDEQREVQREVLGIFAELALDLDLPLNVHSRSAGHYTVDFLIDCGVKKVQMHAFDGRATYAERGAEAGFYFSVPPSIVRSPQKEKLVKRLPLDRILLETDSPVLGPNREERNEPANIRHALGAVARIHDLPEEDVAASVYQNTVALYGERIERAEGEAEEGLE